MTFVPFTEWTPDSADFNNANTGDISNVLCSKQSYIPFPDLAPFTTALPAQPLGYFRARSQSGQVTIFAGTATKLYRLDNTTLAWVDITKYGSSWVEPTSGLVAGAALPASNTAGVSSPTNGALTATAGGALGATTYFVKTTWVNALGETLPSAETSLAVGANMVLNVAPPANPPAGVTGWNVYVSTTTGTETKQNGGTPIALVNYAANTTAQWCFDQFGDYVVAVNINDNPQVFQLGVSTTFNDLGGSPPKAAFVRAWGDFLCLMQLAGNPNRAQWSGLNNIAFWTPGSNNSDFQDFPEGGVVQGSSRATNPIIFLERAIYRATFVPGSSVVFTFQKIQDKRGAKSPYSIASRGDNTFYADEGGFFQIGSDGSIAGIGFEKVDRTIFGQMSASNIAGMVGAIDPFYSRVYWTVDLTGKGTFGNIVIYDWQQQRWSIASQDNVGIFPAATAGYTLEGLDAVSSSLDALPYSLDSKVWQGGAPILAAFTTDYKLGFFNGQAKQATITTQEQGDVTGSVALLTSAYSVVDTNTYTVAVATRMKRGDNVTWTSEMNPNSRTGRVDLKVAGRFVQVRTTIPAGTIWHDAQGIEVTTQPAGSH